MPPYPCKHARHVESYKLLSLYICNSWMSQPAVRALEAGDVFPSLADWVTLFVHGTLSRSQPVSDLESHRSPVKTVLCEAVCIQVSAALALLNLKCPTCATAIAWFKKLFAIHHINCHSG